MPSPSQLSRKGLAVGMLVAVAWGLVAWQLADLFKQLYVVYEKPDGYALGLIESAFYGVKFLAACIGGAFGLSLGCFLAGARGPHEHASEDNSAED